ncbi:hypothetical protein SynBIOSU31_00794 [Synechococcus sp. BIOS-U3-1]|nr:hypothetical protein SynBIOSU31_00794 [Synechococcus sp. BIOS-U3-1]
MGVSKDQHNTIEITAGGRSFGLIDLHSKQLQAGVFTSDRAR